MSVTDNSGESVTHPFLTDRCPLCGAEYRDHEPKTRACPIGYGTIYHQTQRFALPSPASGESVAIPDDLREEHEHNVHIIRQSNHPNPLAARMNSLIERVGRAEKLSPMQRFARNMPVIAEELGPSEPANDKGLAGSDGPGALPCGHHPSLFIKSVESDAQWCELCDMRSQRNDAVQMEHHYRERLEVAERALRDAETRGWNAALKEIAAGFHPERYRSVHVLAEELARPSQSPEEGQ